MFFFAKLFKKILNTLTDFLKKKNVLLTTGTSLM